MPFLYVRRAFSAQSFGKFQIQVFFSLIKEINTLLLPRIVLDSFSCVVYLYGEHVIYDNRSWIFHSRSLWIVCVFEYSVRFCSALRWPVSFGHIFMSIYRFVFLLLLGYLLALLVWLLDYIRGNGGKSAQPQLKSTINTVFIYICWTAITSNTHT